MQSGNVGAEVVFFKCGGPTNPCRWC